MVSVQPAGKHVPETKVQSASPGPMGEGGGGEGGEGGGGGGEGPAQGCLGSTAPAKRKLRP